MSETVVRFSLRQRVEHFLVMTTFTLLALTGFPQKFYEAGWAHAVVAFFGGMERLRFVHRMCGLLFAALAVVHVTTIAAKLARGTARPTLVPTRKDFTDAVLTLRYYLGLSDRHAAFDRFDYRQKFEYWGLLLGGVIMVLTGLVLYFPLITVQWLPGEFVPAAKVAHSNEGLMAFLVVITWHIYNAHLSPDTFPFDTSIFTGRISRERMEHEHPLELARIDTARETPVARTSISRSADANEPPAAPTASAKEGDG
jgi:formate dehydrogenase subunit gamma